jgi:hypothetical protein
VSVVLSAFRDGLRRVWRAGWLVLGVWVSTLALAAPAAWLLRGLLADHLGASLMAEQAARGVNYDWWQEFLAQSTGFGQTFTPAVIGFAAVLDSLSRLADNTPLAPALLVLVGAQVLVSLFLAGGVIDRLARDRAVGAGAFFAACGTFFFRFLRLGLGAALVYWALFAVVHPWLFDVVYPAWTHDFTEERTAFAARAALYLPFSIMVMGVNVLVDYAKIRAVVEDRRSMIGAAMAGARFVARHPAKTLGLYLLDTVLFLAVTSLYALAAPGASAGVVLAFVIGQLYIVLRVVVRLQFAASQTALFQSRLAHAGYVATRVPRWPDSPAAEALRP